MSKIKIAQIGVNRHSHAAPIFDTLKKCSDLFEIAGYAIVEDERETCAERINKHFAEYPELTLETILSDPTIVAVTVETDEIHLTKYAQMAAEHGKHIHMEKPGSQDQETFEKLIETVRTRGLVFHTGYMYRYNPLIREVQEQIGRGEFGDLISIEAHMNCHHSADTREWLNTFEGGMMFFLGCHLVDLVLLLQGTSTRVIPLNKRTGMDGVNSEDFGMAVLEYPRGYSFIKTSAAEWGGYQRRQLVITGTKKSVELKPLELASPTGQYDLITGRTVYGEEDTWKTVGRIDKSIPFDRYEQMLRAFGAMVRGEIKNPYSYDYELTVFRTLMACCGTEEIRFDKKESGIK